MGAKWNEFPEATKTSIESAIMKKCGSMDKIGVAQVMGACWALGYNWLDNEGVRNVIFPVFQALLSRRVFNHPQEQVDFVNSIKELAEVGVEWATIPENEQMLFLEGIHKRSPFVFEPRELSKLLYG
jgi:hypothetical protein